MATSFVTYVIKGMRVLRPSAKVAEANPDRFATVKGTEFRVRTTDEKGKVTLGPVLTIAGKDITFEMATTEGVVIDKENGILTIPTGERGRKELPGLSAEELAAELAALREAASAEAPAVASAEAPAEAPPAE